MANQRKLRKVPSSLAHGLDPKKVNSSARNADGTFVTYGIDGDLMVGPINQLFGEPETTAVEEALVAVQRAESRIAKLQETLPKARDQRDIAIENFTALVRSLEKFQETGEADDRIFPNLDRAVRRVIQKDRRQALKAMNKNLPAAIYLAVRSDDFHIHKKSVDANFEYVTIARRRKNPLTEAEVRQNALEKMRAHIKIARNGPDEERLMRALLAAKINIEKLWSKEKQPLIEVKPVNIREALLDAAGDFEVEGA